ncbi:MAG: TRAP transporter large permease [Peptococcaceae bacterium]
MTGLYAILLFLAFLALRVPIAIALGLASVSYLFFFADIPIIIVVQQMASAIDKFTLMAIPFFIMAGGIMEHGGISKKLIQFASAVVGFFPGGLAMVMVFASMLFAGMTGSGAADAAAIGSIVIPAMVRAGYGVDFSCALQATAGIVGPLIPPSILMVLFGVSAGTSVGDMLLAGFIPGVLMGLLTMAAAVFISVKRGYKREGSFSVKNLGGAFKDAFWALLTPIIIMGGIYSGIFTPTEAAAVAVLYSLFVGLFIYKGLTIKNLPKVIFQTILLSSAVMIIVATSQAFSWILTREGLPHLLADLFKGISSNSLIFLFSSSLMLLLVGCFLDPAPSVLILAPILTPVAESFGINPVHFGVIMVASMCIGLITPPVGLNIFVISGIANRPVHKIIKEIFPFLIASVIALILIIVFPGLSLYLPSLSR